jgi:hypothetical protein
VSFTTIKSFIYFSSFFGFKNASKTSVCVASNCHFRTVSCQMKQKTKLNLKIEIKKKIDSCKTIFLQLFFSSSTPCQGSLVDTTLSVTSLSIMTLSIKGLDVTFSLYDTPYNNAMPFCSVS